MNDAAHSKPKVKLTSANRSMRNLNAFAFTLLTNHIGLMTKELSLAPDGKIQKKPACALAKGTAFRMQCMSLVEFAKLFPTLKPNQALCYGVARRKQVDVVTQEMLEHNTDAIARDRAHFRYAKSPGLMMFDYDPPAAPLPPELVISKLRSALPEASNVAIMWRPSASSCVRNAETGEEIRKIAGLRIWMIVSDASEIPRIGHILFERLWALGLGYFKISKSGALLDRTLLDGTVWTPEHIDFVAGAVCKEPLVQQLPNPQIEFGSVKVFDAKIKLELTADEIEAANANRRRARAAVADEGKAVRYKWLGDRVEEYLRKDPRLTREIAESTLLAACESGELHSDFVLHSQNFGLVTVGAVLANRTKFHGTRFADPLEPDYHDDDRIAYSNLEAERPYIWSFAHGGQRFVLLDAHPSAGNPVSVMDELNAEYGIVPIGANVHVARRTVDSHTGFVHFTFLKKEGFSTLMQNRQRPDGNAGHCGNYWLNHSRRREFKGVVFHPTFTPIGYLNLFQGFPIVPIKGSAKLFWTLVREIICAGNDEAYIYVRRWLAHLIQRPDELPEVALVLRGGEGAGKNTFTEAIGHLLGQHFVTLNAMDQVTGRFTGHTKEALLVNANEAIWGGNKQQIGALKSMITDKRLPIEQKGVDIIFIDNFRRVIVNSNERWAVPAGIDDRRFVFLDVTAARVRDYAFFTELHKELDNGGYEALMYDLMNEDITSFNPRVRPNTGFGFDVKLASADSMVRWLHDVLQEGGVTVPDQYLGPHFYEWGEVRPKQDMYDSYLLSCRRTHMSHPDDASGFHKKIRQILPTMVDKRTTLNPAASSATNTRERCYVLPSLDDARRAYERYMHADGIIKWATASAQQASHVQPVQLVQPLRPTPIRAKVTKRIR